MGAVWSARSGGWLSASAVLGGGWFCGASGLHAMRQSYMNHAVADGHHRHWQSRVQALQEGLQLARIVHDQRALKCCAIPEPVRLLLVVRLLPQLFQVQAIRPLRNVAGQLVLRLGGSTGCDFAWEGGRGTGGTNAARKQPCQQRNACCVTAAHGCNPAGSAALLRRRWLMALPRLRWLKSSCKCCAGASACMHSALSTVQMCPPALAVMYCSRSIQRLSALLARWLVHVLCCGFIASSCCKHITTRVRVRSAHHWMSTEPVPHVSSLATLQAGNHAGITIQGSMVVAHCSDLVHSAPTVLA